MEEKSNMSPPPSPSKLQRNTGIINRSKVVLSQVSAVVLLGSILLLTLHHHDSVQKARRAAAIPQWVHLKEVSDTKGFMLDPSNNTALEYFARTMKNNLKRPKGHNRDKALFDLTVKRPLETFGALDPMWSCQDSNALQGRPKKLVFTHVFKTAGAAMRAILRAYAHHCHAGVAIVNNCAQVSLQSLESGDWWTGDEESRNKCELKTAETRDLASVEGQPHINTAFLNQHIDILAGYVPLGSGYHWKNDQEQHVDVQYLAFFREPIPKYVSSILFKTARKKVSFNKTIAWIKNRVTEEVRYGKYYDRYTQYLITPEQRAAFDEVGVKLSFEQSTNVAMANLVELNVLVGIVERMPESLEMLQYVLDRDEQLTSLFEFFGTRKSNEARLSTQAIIRELEKDAAFMVKLRKYVKYEEKVRLFALDLHMRQYRWLQQQKNRSQSLA